MNQLAGSSTHNAVERLSKVWDETPREAIELNANGLRLVMQGKLNEALATFSQAIMLAPSYRSARLNRAQVLEKLGRHTEARSDREATQAVLSIPTETMEPQPAEQPPVLASSSDVAWAKTAIVFSYIFAVAGLSFGVWAGVQQGVQTAIALPIVFAYLFWSAFWGLVLLGPSFGKLVTHSRFGPVGIFYFPAYLGWAVVYGALGGGIYKLIQCRKILRQGRGGYLP